MNKMIATLTEISTKNVNKIFRKVVEPLSFEAQAEFNSFLMAHNLIKGRSAKRMRIYRKIGEYKVERRLPRSRDFVYVVSADDWRADKEAVKAEILEKSKQVMDPELIVKNAKYASDMSKIEKVLLYKGIEMNWYNGKSVTFNRINHVITDRNILSYLDKYFEEKAAELPSEINLKKFRVGARLKELKSKYKLDWDRWAEHNIITDSEGKVLAAYSYKDMTKIGTVKFKVGLQDKFGYNLNIVKKENLAEFVKNTDDLNMIYKAIDESGITFNY